MISNGSATRQPSDILRIVHVFAVYKINSHCKQISSHFVSKVKQDNFNERVQMIMLSIFYFRKQCSSGNGLGEFVVCETSLYGHSLSSVEMKFWISIFVFGLAHLLILCDANKHSFGNNHFGMSLSGV